MSSVLLVVGAAVAVVAGVVLFFKPFLTAPPAVIGERRVMRESDVAKGDASKLLVIFGAAGLTGRSLVSAALAAGYAVRAVVRTAAKFEMNDARRLTVFEADVLSSSEDRLRESVRGAFAVMSALGHTNVRDKNVTIYSKGIGENLLMAMQKEKVDRIVICTAQSMWADRRYDRNNSVLFELVIKRFFLWAILNDMATLESQLPHAAAWLNFTTVRPPGLSNTRK